MPDDRARTAATIGALLGLAAIGFAALGLAVVGMQRMLLTSIAAGAPADALRVLDVFDAVHGAWLVHMPLWIVVGALLLGTGLGVRRGSIAAGWLQLSCVLAVLELCAYGLHVVFVVLPAFEGVLAQAGLGATPVRVLGGAGALLSLVLALPFLAIAQIVGARAPSGPGRVGAP